MSRSWWIENRWPLLFSFALHLAIALGLLGLQPAEGRNRMQMISLVSLADLEPNRPPQPDTDATARPQPLPDREEFPAIEEEPADVPESPPAEPIAQSIPETPAEAPAPEMEAPPSPAVTEAPNPSETAKNPTDEKTETTAERSEEEVAATESTEEPTALPSPDVVTTQQSASAPPPARAVPPPRSTQSGSQLLENNQSLSNIISAAARLPQKAPPQPVKPLPPNSELLQMLEGIDLVPVGAPTTIPSSALGPPQAALSQAEAQDYSEQINRFIVALWQVPFHLVGSDLTTVVRFKIQPSGKILSYRVEGLSGNKALDDSVVALLRELRFLPPLPDSYAEPSYEFGVRFSPQSFQF